MPQQDNSSKESTTKGIMQYVYELESKVRTLQQTMEDQVVERVREVVVVWVWKRKLTWGAFWWVVGVLGGIGLDRLLR